MSDAAERLAQAIRDLINDAIETGLRPQAARRNIGPCTHPQTTAEHISAGKSIARQHRNARKYPQTRWTEFALYFDV
jgi:hypothetical protein